MQLAVPLLLSGLAKSSLPTREVTLSPTEETFYCFSHSLGAQLPLNRHLGGSRFWDLAMFMVNFMSQSFLLLILNWRKAWPMPFQRWSKTKPSSPTRNQARN